MARKNDKRQQIMRAAERLFSGKRFHEVTISDVARIARVGKGTIYQYFEDKEDLFFQTLTSGFDEMCEALQGTVPQNAPFGEQLMGACATIDGVFASRKHLFEMLQVEDARMAALKGKVRQSWLEHHNKLAAALGGVIARGVGEGAIRRDLAPKTLAILLLGLLKTRAQQLEKTPEQFSSLEAIIALFLRGAGSVSAKAAPQSAHPA